MVYTPVEELPTPPPRRPTVRWTDPAGREWSSEDAARTADASVARTYLQAMRAELDHTHTFSEDDPRRAAAIARARAERTHTGQVAS